MAARLRPRHQEDIKKKIQASQIINRLQDYFNGKVQLTPGQIQSAKILLDKSVSNAPTEIAGPGEKGEVLHRIEWVIVDAN